ncbi:MTHFS [Lepeophtheirus salmonis]|uniref:5-formyltetrahydrofolate cyclo-ligase n=1 Tax=Lepeophtheirus salmonis TaxID=72036 RepID=A0A7R8CG80_LEPSM|nr:MTHFS [Lepeophtheirus salmonis]CAF2813264.1 MTHFS [Lepeophtheirus salmonis]
MASSTHNPVVSQKKKMRQMAKSAIKSLGYEEKKRQTKEVTRQLLQNPLYLSAERISVYLHMKDWEIGTVEILENSFRSSKKCYVPQYFMHPEPIMNMVELYDMKDFENLPITKWHIKQPPAENRDREVTKNLDLVLVPGLAFTKDGKRLGRDP